MTRTELIAAIAQQPSSLSAEDVEQAMRSIGQATADRSDI